MAWGGTDTHVFGAFIESCVENIAAFDIIDDTLKVALFNNTPTPDEDATAANSRYTQGQWLTTSEVSDGTNWDAGGEPLATPTGSFATGTYTFDGADTVQGGASCTLANVYGCLLYDDTLTTPAADQGVAFFDFGGVQSVTSGDMTVQWHTNGIFTFAY